jgi:biotin carboxyl carrier protein
LSEVYFINIAGREYEVQVSAEDVTVNGEKVDIDLLENDNGATVFRSGGKLHKFILDRSEAQNFLLSNGRELPITVETNRDRLLKLAASASASGVHHAEIKAAMPGMVIRISAKVGESVKKGEPVLILEAMKMENEVRAPVDGVIREIHASVQESVEKGDVLVVFE